VDQYLKLTGKLFTMDSINKNQVEDNHENLSGKEAIKKIQELIKKNDTCFFCTRIATNKSFVTRPMSVQKADDDGNLWMLSAVDSHKNAEIKADPAVQLLFRGSDHSDFLSLYGTASISKDKAKIKELWNPMIKAWFTEGEDDPRITVIKVEPLEGYYWDTKHGNVVAFVKTMVGAAIGKTMDDSVEGTIKV
jgi:general stress protein 26